MKRKNPAAVALGSITSPRKAASSATNAKKALAARNAMTPRQRSAQARKAAEARWGKR